MSTNSNFDSFESFEEDFSSDSDFFSIAEEEEDTVEEGEEEISEDSEEDKKPKKKVQLPPAEDLFEISDEDEEDEEDIDEEEEDEEEEEAKPKKKASSDSYLSALNRLKEKGLVEYTLEEGVELDEALAEDLLEDAYENAVETRVENLLKDVPDIVKDLNKYVIKGGKPEDFLKAWSTQNNSQISEDMDMTKEENQIAIKRHILKEQGYDDEYIDAQIEFLKDSKRLETHAKKDFEVWKKDKQKINSELQKERDLQREKDNEERPFSFNLFKAER